MNKYNLYFGLESVGPFEAVFRGTFRMKDGSRDLAKSIPLGADVSVVDPNGSVLISHAKVKAVILSRKEGLTIDLADDMM